jgi:hypothetical protein
VAKEEQLQWERRWAPWAAAAAFLGALLPLGATIYGRSLLGQVDNDRQDEVLQKVHEHGGGYFVVGVLTAIGIFLIAPALVYLYRAVLARRTLIPRVAVMLALAGPLFAGGVGLASQIVVVHTADDFVSTPAKPLTDAQKAKLAKITDANQYEKEVLKLGRAGDADQRLKSGSVATVAYVGLVANLLLGTAFVLISMHAMRAGLLSRFMGILGVIVGALTAIPILGGGGSVVQLFWLVAMGILFLDRWPQGRGPAWAAVEEVPWPTAQDRRDALTEGGGAPARGGGGLFGGGRARAAAAARADAEEPDEDYDEVENDEPAQLTREAARPRPSSDHPRSKKRKRKRRG